MKKIFPVIHLVDTDQMLKNIETCISVGINQVFIINHITDHKDLLKNAIIAREKYPNLWIGLNFLDLNPFHLLKMDIPFDALWIDDTLYYDTVEDKKFKGEIFSGLNFKYQRQFSGDELHNMCKIIKNTSTVACTSGTGTGKEASIIKIETLKKELGSFPLALASGVSSDNIEKFLPYVDYFLVASSITDNEIINKGLLQELFNKLLKYK